MFSIDLCFLMIGVQALNIFRQSPLANNLIIYPAFREYLYESINGAVQKSMQEHNS